MKEVFRAKDIQQVLNISKIRYEYLTSKMGIAPSVEEVEGTGYSHLFSLEDMMFFALAHHSNRLGIGPKGTKDIIKIVKTLSTEFDKSIVEIDTNPPSVIYLVAFREFKAVFIDHNYKITGEPIQPRVRDVKASIPENRDDARRRIKRGTNLLKQSFILLNFRYEYEKTPRKSLEKSLDMADGYITINWRAIKKRVIEELSKLD